MTYNDPTSPDRLDGFGEAVGALAILGFLAVAAYGMWWITDRDTTDPEPRIGSAVTIEQQAD